jgi:threonine synthase
MESVTDEEAYRALHVLAKLEGLSMEPAAAVAFAGLIKLVRSGVIPPDAVVVLNCSGHTFPIQTEVLGEGWSRDVELPTQDLMGTEAPRELAARPQEGHLAALQRLDERVRSIAIVDDNPDAARLIRRILQAKGSYEIHQAANGRDGLALIRERRPDLVVLDLMMPEMDGFEFLKRLRAMPDGYRIPVLVVTAMELSKEDRLRLNGYMTTVLEKDDKSREQLLGEVTELVKGCVKQKIATSSKKA